MNFNIKHLFINFQYWITFILIPFIVFFIEIKKVFSEISIITSIKKEMAAQWYRYKQFNKIKTTKKD